MPRPNRLAVLLLLLAAPACKSPATILHVSEGDTVALGVAGAPRDGTTFQWVQTPDGSGPSIRIDDATSDSTDFIAPESARDYELTFERLDRVGDSTHAHRIEVQVFADDDPPLADAGSPLTAVEGERITLQGAGSDPERRDLTYHWSQSDGPQVALETPREASCAFTAPDVGQPTYLQFELTVSDGANLSLPDEVSVQVQPVNSMPVADAGPDTAVTEGTRVTVRGSGTDGDADTRLRYRWRVLTERPLIGLDVADIPDPSFVAPLCAPGQDSYDLELELVVNDGIVDSPPDVLRITVQAVDDPPEVAIEQPKQEAVEGDVVRLRAEAFDPEGKPVTYRWSQTEGEIQVSLLDADQAEARFTAPRVPDGKTLLEAAFAVVASDAARASEPAVARVVVRPGKRPLHALAVDEVLRLLGGTERDFLERWNGELSAAGASSGFFANVAARTLTSVFRTAERALECDLPPGTWRFQGSISLRDVEPQGSSAYGELLRFETDAGQAAAIGVVQLGGKVGVQVVEYELGERDGEWRSVSSTDRLLDSWATNKTLHVAVTWRGGMLRFQWSGSPATVLEQPERHVELTAPPERLVSLTRFASVALEDLRLIGVAP